MSDQEQDRANKNQKYFDKIQELDSDLKKAIELISKLRADINDRELKIKALESENHDLNVRLSNAYSKLHR